MLGRALPAAVGVDNGPEFARRALDQWAHRCGVELQVIRLGKPVENAYIESFNGRLRDDRVRLVQQDPTRPSA